MSSKKKAVKVLIAASQDWNDMSQKDKRAARQIKRQA